jgi:hypothetical protein
MTALDDLAALPRWIAWRYEIRTGKPTKVPYAPRGGTAKANDPATWGTRAAAEAQATKIANGVGGGVGIMLGDLCDGTVLGGIDLDACIGDDGASTPWADAILAAVPSYAERSPSGRGIKLFFRVPTDHVRPFLDRIGVHTDAFGCRRSVPGANGADHGPAIEVYLSHRYFTVTEEQLSGSPDEIALLDEQVLNRLTRLIPPGKEGANSSAGAGSSPGNSGDNSRSARAYRLGYAMHRAAREQFRAALLADPDLSDWYRAKGSLYGDREFERAWSLKGEAGSDDGGGGEIDVELLRGTVWLERDIAESDFLLGELLSTTSRVELIGPTGLGKTNLLVAMALAVADGRDFLHWQGSSKPRRVLYVDGEMSRRLAKQRLNDAVRRHGRMPEGFFYFNSEDFPSSAPLNTAAGQRFADRVIAAVGGCDLAIFDNVQALLSGNMSDEEPWQLTLPWVRDLTRRGVGQIWAHHTGHDTSHGYGTKTREWQLDTVAMMRASEPAGDAEMLRFELKFPKARERTPQNRHDFEPVTITLADDKWSGSHGRVPKEEYLVMLLMAAISRDGEILRPAAGIPPGVRCVREESWRNRCGQGSISADTPDAHRMAFKRFRDKLVKKGRIGVCEPWVWICSAEAGAEGSG